MDDRKPSAGYTVRDLARRYRVGGDKVRAWIKRGELAALDTSDRLNSKPRYVVTAESLQRFEMGRQAAQPPKTPRRKRLKQNEIDFFPDD